MNKTILIAGGASVASLVAGGAAGYFYARHKFDATVEELITAEVEKTKKIYTIRLMEAQKPKTPADIPIVDEDEPLVIEEDPEVVEEATSAQTDYRGLGKKLMEEKPPLSDLVERNIFTENATNGIGSTKPKKTLPPRGPGGKFQPAKQTVPDDRAPEDPYMITHEEFFDSPDGYDQETLVWFPNDHTLVVKADFQETVDVERVGEVHLTLFPETDNGLVRSIAVRNEKYHIDYDIELNEGSLTEALGLGESEVDLPDGAFL